MAVTGQGEGRQLTAGISGEVDHHRAGEIMAELERLIDTRLPLRTVVDLSGVSFMDSSGIAVILRAYRRMGELGGELWVRGTPPQAARVLHAAGLERMIHFEE